MAQVTLDRAIALLSSDKVKERSDGLGDLKHILQQNKKSLILDPLSDKEGHKIFEALFRVVSIERSTYNRVNAPKSKAISASRLSACASVLRITIESSLRNLRMKSVYAIVDHIIQTVPEQGHGLWECLGTDYMKCLRILLQHPAHVEHLGENQCLDILKFCLQHLDLTESDGSQLSIRTSHHSTAESMDGGGSHSAPMKTTPNHAGKLGQSDDNKTTIEDAVACLQFLTASTNSPIQPVAEKLLNGLSNYLLLSPQFGSSHQAAFKTINFIVARALCNQSNVVRNCLLEIIPTVRRLWGTKFPGLKDEILVTLTLCMDLLVNISQLSPTESTVESIEGLMDVLLSEYMKRPEKETLQLEDVVFWQGACVEGGQPAYGPRLGNSKSEHNWTVIWVIARLLSILDDTKASSSNRSSVDKLRNKKPRLSSRIDDIIRTSFSSSGSRRACALQLIPFLVGRMDTEVKVSLLERLTANILDDNGLLASWTLLAIGRCACSSYLTYNSLFFILISCNSSYFISN
jgi:ataxia telangiectasia mutated family protein